MSCFAQRMPSTRAKESGMRRSASVSATSSKKGSHHTWLRVERQAEACCADSSANSDVPRIGAEGFAILDQLNLTATQGGAPALAKKNRSFSPGAEAKIGRQPIHKGRAV